jgi:hypothetical protein
VGNDRIGVFAVALPMDFVIKSAADSRTAYVILFTVVFLLVMVIGFVGVRLAINPLYSLEKKSLAPKNISNREKRQWVLFILFLPVLIFLMIIAGQVATRLVPNWSINAGMESKLDPNNLPMQQSRFVQSISPEIMTPLGWLDTFLTPSSGSEDQIFFPPLVEFELSTTPSPSPTSTKTTTKTASPSATATSSPATVGTPSELLLIEPESTPQTP